MNRAEVDGLRSYLMQMGEERGWPHIIIRVDDEEYAEAWAPGERAWRNLVKRADIDDLMAAAMAINRV